MGLCESEPDAFCFSLHFTQLVQSWVCIKIQFQVLDQSEELDDFLLNKPRAL